MVTGILRTVLWVLGGLASLWLLLGIVTLVAMFAMGGMMPGAGMGMGGMDRPEVTGMGIGMDGRQGMGLAWMITMMGMMGSALIALVGLVGVFFYLVSDSLRKRRDQTASG